jgi:hypothetical protein
MTNVTESIEPTYTYINPESRPLVIKILATIILLFGLLQFGLLTIVLGLGSIGLFMYAEGIEIDFLSKQYRLIKSFGPMRFGKWQPFTATNYISVFKTTLVSSVSGRSGTSISSRENVIKVNIIFSKSNRVLAFQTEDKEEAFKVACQLAEKLHMKIWDATAQKGQWAHDGSKGFGISKG